MKGVHFTCTKKDMFLDMFIRLFVFVVTSKLVNTSL